VGRLDTVQRNRGDVEALEGTGKPFVVTSGLLTAPGRLGTEEDPADPDSPVKHRHASEAATLALAERGVSSSVLRLPPSVHGEGDYGFVPMFIDFAREKGVSAMVGDGSNRCAARRGPAVPAGPGGGTGGRTAARDRRRGGALP
jgi:hypothetical protein